VTLRLGRFGPYLQLGEPKDWDDEKPKRSSIPKGIDANTVDLDLALKLLGLPREVGPHPETGKMITAGLGRFGPFILHDGTYANVDSIDEVFTVGINRAVTLLAEKKAGKGGRFGRAAQRQVLKDLGEHPDGSGKIEVLNGRYGPYVSHNKINANVPRGKDPAALTVDEAVALLAERAAKGDSGKGKGRFKKKSAKPDDGAGTDAPKKGAASKKKESAATGEKAPPKRAAAKKTAAASKRTSVAKKEAAKKDAAE
jgi:DNA topoisomerase-1